jgi:superfamily II DNA helicase RecQ
MAPETKLGYEREHQTEIEASKRSLVYSRRKDLRTALYSLRMELAREQHKQPPCVVFDNAAIDHIVIKLQTNESELIKCRGIGNTRC